MTTATREKFFTFNLGHLLTLLTILASVAGLFAASARSDERQESRLGYIDNKLSDHAAVIALHTDAIAKLDKLGTTRSTANLANDNERISLLQRSVADHEVQLRQLAVMANDLAWIKDEMIRRRKEP
jgi:hypothetical protein